MLISRFEIARDAKAKLPQPPRRKLSTFELLPPEILYRIFREVKSDPSYLVRFNTAEEPPRISHALTPFTSPLSSFIFAPKSFNRSTAPTSSTNPSPRWHHLLSAISDYYSTTSNAAHSMRQLNDFLLRTVGSGRVGDGAQSTDELGGFVRVYRDAIRKVLETEGAWLGQDGINRVMDQLRLTFGALFPGTSFYAYWPPHYPNGSLGWVRETFDTVQGEAVLICDLINMIVQIDYGYAPPNATRSYPTPSLRPPDDPANHSLEITVGRLLSDFYVLLLKERLLHGGLHTVFGAAPVSALRSVLGSLPNDYEVEEFVISMQRGEASNEWCEEKDILRAGQSRTTVICVHRRVGDSTVLVSMVFPTQHVRRGRLLASKGLGYLVFEALSAVDAIHSLFALVERGSDHGHNSSPFALSCLRPEFIRAGSRRNVSYVRTTIITLEQQTQRITPLKELPPELLESGVERGHLLFLPPSLSTSTATTGFDIIDCVPHKYRDERHLAMSIARLLQSIAATASSGKAKESWSTPRPLASGSTATAREQQKEANAVLRELPSGKLGTGYEQRKETLQALRELPSGKIGTGHEQKQEKYAASIASLRLLPSGRMGTGAEQRKENFSETIRKRRLREEAAEAAGDQPRKKKAKKAPPPIRGPRPLLPPPGAFDPVPEGLTVVHGDFAFDPAIFAGPLPPAPTASSSAPRPPKRPRTTAKRRLQDPTRFVAPIEVDLSTLPVAIRSDSWSATVPGAAPGMLLLAVNQEERDWQCWFGGKWRKRISNGFGVNAGSLHEDHIEEHFRFDPTAALDCVFCLKPFAEISALVTQEQGHLHHPDRAHRAPMLTPSFGAVLERRRQTMLRMVARTSR